MILTEKLMSLLLILFHLCIIFWWFSDSAVLHSPWGIALWILSPILGFIVARKLPTTQGKFLSYTSIIVVVLGVLAIMITFITISML